MTDRQKQWLENGGFSKLTLFLLGLIATGMGWLIAQNNIRLNHQEELNQKQELMINDLRNISSNLVEAYNSKVNIDRKQDDEILELWKCANRGSKSTTLLK